MASATARQADDPGALGVDRILQQVSRDDQDEWEYEYSTTETETYYLTLELSYPEFKERPAKAPHHSRGGYYKNWLDQYSDNPAEPIRHGLDQDHSDNENENENEIDNDNDDEPILEPEPEREPEREDDDALSHIDPMLRAGTRRSVVDTDDRPPKKDEKGKKSGNGEEKDPEDEGEHHQEPSDEAMEEIQILDLHSHNPIISYRGRVFEGQWAEVIGTDTILADRDEGDANPPPALRRLSGGVDILGACSSRILTTAKIPKPKVPEEDSLAAIRTEWNIRIPPGKDRTGERAHQIRFLENLIALKKKKGQTDEVTVYAMDGVGKDFNDKKGPDFKPRKRKPAPGARLSDDGGSSSGRRSRRRRSGRSRSRQGVVQRGMAARGAGGAVNAGDRGRSPTTSGMLMGSGTLSTPTPSHWEELSSAREDEVEEGYDDYEEEEDEEGEEEEEEEDDNSLPDIYEESDEPEGGEETHDDEDEDVTMG